MTENPPLQDHLASYDTRVLEVYRASVRTSKHMIKVTKRKKQKEEERSKKVEAHGKTLPEGAACGCCSGV